MDFSSALTQLKLGARIKRASWKNALFVYLVAGSQFTVNRAPLLGIYAEGLPVDYAPHIDVVTKQENGTVFAWKWAPSISDVLAEDWELVAAQEENVKAAA